MWDHVRRCQYIGVAYFMLPFEVIYMVLQGILDQCTGMVDIARAAAFDAWKSCAGLGAEDGPVLGLGLWGDAAPMLKRDQLYLMVYNIVTGTFHDRFLYCAASKRCLCDCGCKGRCTFEAMFKIFKWSMDQLMAGTFALMRHDGTAFNESNLAGDRWGAKKAGSKLGFKGGLFEKRGDWAWLKQALNMLGWKKRYRPMLLAMHGKFT